MRRLILSGIASILMIGSANAGFNSWSVEKTEADPFTGGSKVYASYMTSMRRATVILCDSASKTLTIRVVPGYTYSLTMELYSPTMEFAIDSVNLGLSVEGETGAVGDNLAIAEVKLTGTDATKFLDAFSGAKKQVAIKDGISTGPFLASARGTTKAAQALNDCLK